MSNAQHLFRLMIVLQAFLLGSCGSYLSSESIPRIQEQKSDSICSEVTTTDNHSATVKLTYTGAGGYLIEFEEEELLLSPFFSNPSLIQVLLPSGESRYRNAADAVSTVVSELKLHDVKAVLITHGHYDHAFDVPFLFSFDRENENFAEIFQEAHIYANQTTVNLLCGDDGVRRVSDDGRLILVPQGAPFKCASSDSKNKFTEFPSTFEAAKKEPDKLTEDRSCRATAIMEPMVPPVKGERVRIWAFSSDHAPHFRLLSRPIVLASGSQRQERGSLPWFHWRWRSGQNYSFVLDFLDADGKTAIRVFLMDALFDSCHLHAAFPTSSEIPTVAVIPSANWEYAENEHADQLMAIRPDVVFLNHWDDFFHKNFLANEIKADVRTYKQGSLSEFSRFVKEQDYEDAKTTIVVARKPGIATTVRLCDGKVVVD